jgi:hypothetical protein
MAIARMNLADMLRNGDDPLSGKSIKEVLDEKISLPNKKVVSNKGKSYRNKKIFNE